MERGETKNKNKFQLHALRRLMQGTPEHPKAPLGNNFRPPQPLLHRPVRTNIDFRTKQNGKLCPTMYRDVHYKGNMTCFYLNPFTVLLLQLYNIRDYFLFVELPFPTSNYLSIFFEAN